MLPPVSAPSTGGAKIMSVSAIQGDAAHKSWVEESWSFVWSEPVKICPRDVVMTDKAPTMEPSGLSCTSVTVEAPTPSNNTARLNFTLALNFFLKYVICNTTVTGMMVSLLI